jgi:hypothetical protein
MEDGRIQGQVCGQEILIDRVLIHEQLGISNEGVVDIINTTFDETKNCFEEDCRSTCLCGK